VKLLLTVRAVGAVLSVTWTEIANVPPAGGVPLSTPVAAASVSQDGREVPIQVYGGVPPEAVSVAEYACPDAAPESELVLIVNGVTAVAVTVSEKVAMASSPVLSATCTVKLNVPAAWGVPVMVPAFWSRLRPAGMFPEKITHV
jgi:hypothetical protein